MTPEAASRPKAEPPDSTIASIRRPGDGIERLGLAAARRAAPDIDRRHGRGFRENHRRAGDAGRIFRLADQQPRHIGDQIARSGSGHDHRPFQALRYQTLPISSARAPIYPSPTLRKWSCAVERRALEFSPRSRSAPSAP